MIQLQNTLLLIAVALLYFAALAALFRSRASFGLGAFFCALGVLHFIETYLAGTLYVPLAPGIVASPGSAALFSGKLALLLLVYIREDAITVRQPIYGLLFGNLLTIAIALLIQQQVPAAPAAHAPDVNFIHQMGGLMVWGTVLLFVDSILVILLYERLRGWLGNRLTARVWIATAAVLTFDQIGFFLALRVMYDAPTSVLLGGWLAKMGAALLYAGLVGAYLRWVERPSVDASAFPRINEVFSVLTYRERYEDLLEQSGHDALTGVLDRRRLEADGPRLAAAAVRAKRPLTVFVIDIDHFKAFNDRFGHSMGDEVLCGIVERIRASMRTTDLVFRFGGEEFVVICEGLSDAPAMALGEHLRRMIAQAKPHSIDAVTASIGIAVHPRDGDTYASLFAVADRRMYEAKAAGRNRVVGPYTRAADAEPIAFRSSPAA